MDDIIDYAMPLMNIERMAKEIHALCLEHRYEEAREKTLDLSIESRMLRAALAHLSEKERGYASTKTAESWTAHVLSQSTAYIAAQGNHG